MALKNVASTLDDQVNTAAKNVAEAVGDAAGEIGILGDETAAAIKPTDDLDRNVRELTSAFDDNVDASQDVRTERRKLADQTWDAADAEDAYFEAVDTMVDALEDSEASERDKAASVRDTARATDDMIRTQLESEGVILDSKRGNELWTDSMLDAATFMGGPLGAEILEHIGRVNGIPEEKITEAKAALDRGSVDEARNIIDTELDKAQANVTVTPVGLQAARDRISAILGRNISIGVNTYVPNRPGSGGLPYGATGGIVTKPTMALIGEAGPEAVVPLNKTPGSSPLPSGGMGGGAPITINVAGVLDDQMAYKIAAEVDRVNRWYR